MRTDWSEGRIASSVLEGEERGEGGKGRGGGWRREEEEGREEDEGKPTEFSCYIPSSNLLFCGY